MPAAHSAAILVVDDRHEQRLSLSALLGEVTDEIVTASSGRDALRQLLQRDFALILLDVNMPDMDGFETAALIRQRKRCEHTPIIFITAYADDAYAARGYSLGAVDYILAPFDPQVLKTKVSVFLDLFRKTEEASRHAEALRVHAAQLRRLAEAATAIHAATSIGDLLKLVADTASSVTEAQQVAVRIEMGEPVSARAGGSTIQRPEQSALDALGREILPNAPARPIRMSSEELDGHPLWSRMQRPDGAPPLRGWLAVPLPGREGRPAGWIQLSERRCGEFTAEDETLVVQLAQMTAIAAENTLFSEVREASQLKDQFLATLSHELRTPLQAILSWAHLIGGQADDRDLLMRGLEVIERNALAQTRLIEELLDVSRIVSGKLVLERDVVALHELLGAAVADAEATARGKQLSIGFERAADQAFVMGDANRLRQVMGNLFSNAIKFTPPGGRISLRLSVDGGDAEICVRDTGQGVAAEFLPHLFERFRQADSGTRRTHGGLGIGLAVVRHLIELHGGSVRAESPGVDAGTSIFLRLPVVDERGLQAEGELATDPDAATLRIDGLRVLLVEDEADARECMALSLRGYGAEVRAVGSVADAMDCFEAEGADVVLSDLAMPGEDGFALIRRIRALPASRGGRVPAAAISAHVRPEERARALLAGFDTHLAKPIEPRELAASVRALSGGRDA